MTETEKLVDVIVRQFGHLDPLLVAVSSVQRHQKRKLENFLGALIDTVLEENKLNPVREDEIAEIRIRCERHRSGGQPTYAEIERLLDAVTVRDNLLADMRQDSTAYRQGHADAASQVLQALREMIAENEHHTSMDASFWIGRIADRLKLDLQSAVELAPPDAIRAENHRLYQALLKTYNELSSRDVTSLSDQVDLALDRIRDNLETALNLSIPF